MRKFGRKKANRNMMLRNLATSLIIFEKVKTTSSKAKELKPIIDRLINLAKKNDLSTRRYLLGYLTHKNAVKKLFEDLIARYQSRHSGYTTSYNLMPRLGDGSSMILIKLLAMEKDIKEEEKDEKENIIANKKTNKDKKTHSPTVIRSKRAKK